jgi:hypothetical protein
LGFFYKINLKFLKNDNAQKYFLSDKKIFLFNIKNDEKFLLIKLRKLTHSTSKCNYFGTALLWYKLKSIQN